MDDPLGVLLKFAFLGVLYLFLLWVARSALRDLSTHDEPSLALEPAGGDGEMASRRERRPDAFREAVSPALEVVAALGMDPGTRFEIGDGATMGRADSSEIKVDDPFASSAHARIFPRGQFMYVEDMGSTNGTYLNGRQLRGAERLKPADVIRIGDSEYRYGE